MEPAQASNEACTVDMALCGEPYELPRPTVWSAKTPIFIGF
jgi:hypothetical protein